MNKGAHERLGQRPPFVIAMERISETPTKGAARAALLAAARWCNYKTGELWASMDNWAKQAGIDVRTLQRALRKPALSKLVEVVSASKGGPGGTSVYRIPLFIVNPGTTSGLEQATTPTHAPPTPAAETHNPGDEDTQPRPHATRNTNETPKETPTTPDSVVVDFLRGIRIQDSLLTHYNATLERLKYCADQVRHHGKGAGWVAKCIREGWQVPQQSQTLAKPKPGEKLAAIRARMAALPEDARGKLLVYVRSHYANLAKLPDDDPAVLGAMDKAHRLQTQSTISAPLMNTQ